MNEEIIYKYLSSEINENEKQQLREWLQASAGNRYYFFELRSIWQAKKQLPESNEELLERSLEELNEKIDALEKGEKKKGSFTHRLRPVMWSVSAAVLLLLIGFSFFHSSREMEEESFYPELFITYVNSSPDSIRTVALPDGSQVWLSEHSTLVCPETFSGDMRSVYLEGEAYFEVTTDSLMPFLVKTDANQIKVFGTSFSVNTRYEEQTNEVILTSGSVQLQRLDGIGLINLIPGQKALYSKDSGTVEINEIDISMFASWKYGLISLSSASLPKILNCLQDTYKVKIEMDTTSLRGKRYHFSFKRSKGVGDALQQLSFMTGVPAKVI